MAWVVIAMRSAFRPALRAPARPAEMSRSCAHAGDSPFLSPLSPSNELKVERLRSMYASDRVNSNDVEDIGRFTVDPCLDLAAIAHATGSQNLPSYVGVLVEQA
jgi:hypothetical protein